MNYEAEQRVYLIDAFTSPLGKDEIVTVAIVENHLDVVIRFDTGVMCRVPVTRIRPISPLEQLAEAAE